MNPEDKFLNPRPVPAPPKLARLNTSPTFPQHPNLSAGSTWSGSPWSARSLSSSRGASPSSTSTLRMFRLPRKASIDGRSRSISPSNKQTGLRAAFRQLTSARPASPDGSINRGRSSELEIGEPALFTRTSSGRISKPSSKPSSKNTSREQSPASSSERQPAPVQASQLAIRRGLEQPPDLQEAFAASSFQSHRRQRSRSREPSSLRNSLTLPDDYMVETSLHDAGVHRYQALETLKEAPSQQNTPTWPMTAKKVDGNDKLPGWAGTALEKRLPTLPNSPSSAYSPSAASDSPAKRLSEELKNLKSHFSEMTVSSPSYSCLVEKDRSHFSQWTTTTIAHSPCSEYCVDAMDLGSQDSSPLQQPTSPYEVHSMLSKTKSPLAREDTLTSEVEMLPSTVSCSTISSCDSTSPPSPSYRNLDLSSSSIDNFASWEKRYGMTADGHLPGFALPESLPASDATLKISKPGAFHEQVNSVTPRVGIRRQNSIDQIPNYQAISHSASMQELIDELSYLGDMIQK